MYSTCTWECLKITCSTSINSAVYKRTGQVRSQITPSDVGARLGRRRSVCKIERDQNLQIIARGSSASNGPSETEQVEKLHSIAGDGGNGDGIGGSGGDGGDNEDGDDKNQPLAPGAGLWFRFASFPLNNISYSIHFTNKRSHCGI